MRAALDEVCEKMADFCAEHQARLAKQADEFAAAKSKELGLDDLPTKPCAVRRAV